MLEIEFLVDSSFFHTLNMSSHCLLAFMIYNETSTVIIIEGPLYLMSHFSLGAFLILFLSLANSSLTMCLDVCPFEFILYEVH